MAFITRKKLFQWHGWLGLNLGLLLFVVCFSGTVAVLSEEIDWLINPDLRVTPGEEHVSWSAMHRNVQAAFPDGYVGYTLMPESPYHAAEVFVQTPSGQTRRVYVNPYTGAVQGSTSYFNVQRFFRSFHYAFFVDTWGIYLVTVFGFVLAFSAVTGLLFYKGWLKQLFTLRRDKGRRIAWSDLHKLAGIWGLVFTLIIAVTGIWYMVEITLYYANESLYIPPPEVPAETLQAQGPQPEPLGVDRYLEIARTTYPGLDIKTFHVPPNPQEPVYVDGQSGAFLVRHRANKVYIDRFSGEVIKIQRAGELSPVYRWVDTADDLHFGKFAGVWSKPFWFVLGLVLSFSILSGSYLWYIRTLPANTGRGRSREEADRQRRTNGQAALRKRPWMRGATLSFVLTTVVLLVITGYTVEGVREYGPLPAQPTATIGQAEIGPWSVRVECAAPCRPDTLMTLTAHVAGSGVPNFRKAMLWTSRAGIEQSDTTGATLATLSRATAHRLTGRVKPSAREGAQTQLWLGVEAWDGTLHTASLSAAAIDAARAELAPVGAPQERSFPEAPLGVWLTIAAFVVATVAVAVFWFIYLRKAARTKQHQAAHASRDNRERERAGQQDAPAASAVCSPAPESSEAGAPESGQQTAAEGKPVSADLPRPGKD